MKFFYSYPLFFCISFASIASASSPSEYEQLLSAKVTATQAKAMVEVIDKEWPASEDMKSEGREYGKSFRAATHDMALYQQIASSNSSLKVLCLACGNAEQSVRMSLLGAQVKGYDILSEVVESAKGRLTRFAEQFPGSIDVEMHFADLLSQEADSIFAKDSYDIITARLFFHFLSPAQQGSILEKIKGALKPGGRLYLLVQGPYLDVEVLNPMCDRVRQNPNGFDHGFAIVHQAELLPVEERYRKAAAKRFNFNSFWPYAYAVTLTDEFCELPSGLNIDGKYQGDCTSEKLPSSFLKKIDRSTLVHYKYNFATIEGCKNMLKAAGLKEAKVKYISSLATLDEELFSTIDSLNKLQKIEKEAILAVSIYVEAEKKQVFGNSEL